MKVLIFYVYYVLILLKIENKSLEVLRLIVHLQRCLVLYFWKPVLKPVSGFVHTTKPKTGIVDLVEIWIP